MEPNLPGTGNISADQSAAAKTHTTKATGTTGTNQVTETTNQDSASFTPPGTQGNRQGGYSKSDGR